MGNVKMGFEGQIFYGSPGSTATTQLTNVGDLAYDIDKEDGDTTIRGTGLSAPIKTSDVTAIGTQTEFTMINDTTDTALQALLTAAATGGVVAIRVKDNVDGKGFDGDCSLSVKNGMPIKGQQTKQFTATPSRSYGRAPQPYV